MFGPDWSEGRGLSKDSPREVSLVEDDAEAMRTICCGIHVPPTLTPEQVLQIAIEADKYDLAVALVYAGLQWLGPICTTQISGAGRLMAVALLFGDTDMFARHTLALIENYTGSYLDLLDDQKASPTLPVRMLFK